MRIKWGEQSREDLRKILEYVGANFGGRKAKSVLAEIRSQAEMLKDFPKLGSPFIKDEESGIDYRAFSSRLNSIVYYIDGETVNIVTVWQTRRDIDSLKKQLCSH